MQNSYYSVKSWILGVKFIIWYIFVGEPNLKITGLTNSFSKQKSIVLNAGGTLFLAEIGGFN